MILQLGIILMTLLVKEQMSWQDEVKKIDRQVATLEELQDKYRSSAQKNANNAPFCSARSQLFNTTFFAKKFHWTTEIHLRQALSAKGS